MTRVSDHTLRETAAKYDSKKEFMAEHPRWYKQAWRRKILDDICAHMGDGRVKWTKEKLLAEAQKYRTRSEFAKGSPHAYHAARARTWLDDICRHMKPTNDTLYVCRIAGTNIYKIGLTSEGRGLERIEHLRKKIPEPLELILYAPFRRYLRDTETRLLDLGCRVDIPGVKSGEFREYTEKDFQKLMQMILERTTEANLPCTSDSRSARLCT